MANKSGKYIQFSWNISAYHPESLQSGFSEKELRQEYSRLRKVANKRLQRLERSEFADSQTVRYNKDRFVPLSQIGSKSDLAHVMSDLARFLTAARGSITGLREERRKAIETWQDTGASFVNESNYNDWVEFLEFAKDFIGKPYLETAKEIFQQGEKAGLTGNRLRENFAGYLENYENTGSIVPGDFDE